jgi:glycosyltransferase involved in cell wall biosynthesis
VDEDVLLESADEHVSERQMPGLPGAPAVSVITPSKNRLNLLCETIDSVQTQSFANWEHIIVDDGSGDGTAEEVLRRAKADPRIRYIRRTGAKSGANVCRNIGITESRAELIIFLDSDDLLKPDCLDRRVSIMRRNPDLDFAVFCAAVFRDRIGDLQRLYHSMEPGDDLLRFLSHECIWEISGPIWRRPFLKRIEGFDESLLSMQDLEMHVRALSIRPKYLCFQDADHDIRWQDDSTKTSVRHFNDPVYIAANEALRTKLHDTVRDAGLLNWSRSRALLGLYFASAELWIRLKQLRPALATWRKGCHHLQAPAFLKLEGIAILITGRLIAQRSELVSRFTNRWKGWQRFRPELALPSGAMYRSLSKQHHEQSQTAVAQYSQNSRS